MSITETNTAKHKVTRAREGYDRAQERAKESRENLVDAARACTDAGNSEGVVAELAGVSRPTLRRWFGKSY